MKLELSMIEVIHLLACVYDRDITREGGWILGRDMRTDSDRPRAWKYKDV